MNLELAEGIKNAIEDNGHECEIYENYSGRGMFGTTTTGIVVESEIQIIESILATPRFFIEKDFTARFDPQSLQTDNMGKRFIIY